MRVDAGRPTGDDGTNFVVGCPVHQISACLASQLAQCLGHGARGGGQRGQVQPQARAKFGVGGLGHADDTLDSERRRRQRHFGFWRHRASTFHAAQGLADHAAKEAGCSTIGFTGAHAHGHQTRAAAFDKTLAGEVRHELFTNVFLDAVTGLRCGQGAVFNHRRVGQAGCVTKHRQRTGKHQHRPGLQRTAGFQDAQRRPEVAVHAQIKIRLAFATDGGGQVEDDGGLCVDETAGCGGHQRVQVTRNRRHTGIGEQVGWRVGAVYQNEFGNGCRGGTRQ